MAKKQQDNPDDSRLESDEDLDDVVDSVIGAEENSKEITDSGTEEVSIEELLAASAKMVVETCMDIRRGENVLIVCDPTTGDIGQALHEATIKKSERVLLIVMPKAKHHGEEPPTPVANLMRQQQVVLAPTKYILSLTLGPSGRQCATVPEWQLCPVLPTICSPMAEWRLISIKSRNELVTLGHISAGEELLM